MAEVEGSNYEVRMLRAMLAPFDGMFEALGYEKPSTQLDILDIDYGELKDIASDMGHRTHGSLDAAWSTMREVRSDVSDQWQGHAADQFDDYAALVVDALEREKTLISDQINDIDTMATELENAVKKAYNSALDAVQGLIGLVNPAMGIVMAYERATGGQSSPGMQLAFDIVGYITGVLTTGVNTAISVLATYNGTMSSFANFEEFRTADGRLITAEDRQQVVDHGLTVGEDVNRTGLDEESLTEGQDAWEPV